MTVVIVKHNRLKPAYKWTIGVLDTHKRRYVRQLSCNKDDQLSQFLHNAGFSKGARYA